MLLINNYVYCCGGLDLGFLVMSLCERFDLNNLIDPENKDNIRNEGEWTTDVPEMVEAKFSATMMVMDKTWIYSFGGASNAFESEQNILEIERLNTADIDDPTKTAKWEQFTFKSDYVRCC